ncbi:hypothetical protein UPYG_G00157530 [Umbra pygmaea]|uniref:Beta-microseminoprotein-like n=1 Tax=Umbra pygmaea TaxID=75934 RepID=A0ABD0WYS5_UMBPY
MRSLAVAVILCALLPLSHTACWRAKGNGMTECLYKKDGTSHAVGSKWRTSDCMNCRCLTGGDMECCTAYSTPRSFPDDCIKEFDQKACKYNVFKKNDPSTPCPIYGAVGK